uniref:Heparan-sulfate 6-O-sulfotransferase n=1 Tax=Meloidogyne hapla TaxID=6305 RepID=A0A1I8BM28_MELHA
MRYLNRTPSCLLTTLFFIFFIIYLIYTVWTTTRFNALFNETPSLRFSYAHSQPFVNNVNDDNFGESSLVVSYDQINQDFDKYSNPCICEEGQRRCDCGILDNFGKKRIWLFSRYSTGWVDWACGLHADFTKLIIDNCVDYYFRIKEGQSKNRFYLTTFIREPVDRFISEFSHVKRGARWKKVQHFCNNISKCFESDIKDIELDEFLNCPNNLAFNRQTRMLADLTLIGCDNLVFSDTPTSHFGRLMLESAKKNLQNKFAFFGIKERMNESQILFENIFNIKFSDSLSNWNISKSSDIFVRADQIAQVNQKNQLDLELYSFANKLFNQRIEELKIKGRLN